MASSRRDGLRQALEGKGEASRLVSIVTSILYGTTGRGYEREEAKKACLEGFPSIINNIGGMYVNSTVFLKYLVQEQGKKEACSIISGKKPRKI